MVNIHQYFNEVFQVQCYNAARKTSSSAASEHFSTRHFDLITKRVTTYHWTLS